VLPIYPIRIDSKQIISQQEEIGWRQQLIHRVG
jgi:hypothetical protein